MGQTPLFAAASFGMTDLAKALLDLNARVDKVTMIDGTSWTPLGIACLHKHRTVATLLLKRGARTSAVPQVRESAVQSSKCTHVW